MHSASISNNMDWKYSCAWHANLYHLRNFTLVTTYLSSMRPTIHVTITYMYIPFHGYDHKHLKKNPKLLQLAFMSKKWSHMYQKMSIRIVFKQSRLVNNTYCLITFFNLHSCSMFKGNKVSIWIEVATSFNTRYSKWLVMRSPSNVWEVTIYFL
jgi:hypothetical protein